MTIQLGYSVTQRIAAVTQPRGGYIPPRMLTGTPLASDTSLESPEGVHPGLVGTVVDYLSRFMSSGDAVEAFRISLLGAEVVREAVLARRLLAGIRGLDDASIANAIRLTGFDVAFRAGADRYRPVHTIFVDGVTVRNVRAMVERSLRFFAEYGPVVSDGFTFEGGYTATVRAGDGDFMTGDTLWDFKVSKNPPTKDHTLQVLMYWRMGLHSIHPEFQNVRYLGVYNPRLNVVYRMPVSDIPASVVDVVESEVIGYK